MAHVRVTPPTKKRTSAPSPADIREKGFFQQGVTRHFVDDSATGYLRSNVLSNLDGSSTQTGVPLTLNIHVYDSKNSCAAMQNVQVDIWSCNAAGVYSAESSESTVGQSWLRGYQLTDANGLVTFQTIIPGWYSGRTNHIHLASAPPTIPPPQAAATRCSCCSIRLS